MDELWLIDDDAINNLINKRKLKDRGVLKEIVEYTESPVALNHLKETSKKVLILLDINMPVMNGWRFLTELHKLELDEKCTVFLLTSSVDDQDIKESKKYSVVKGFISKPLDAGKCAQIMDALA